MRAPVVIYQDLNSRTPTKSPFVKNIESIYQSLDSIFSTTPSQRIFNPQFGLAIEDELFEIIDELGALRILSLVTSSVERFEKRVRIDYQNSSVVPFADENRYEITLRFSVVGLSGQSFRYVANLQN